MTRFASTRWSLFLRARGDSADARVALAELCRTYRAPVAAFVRGSGYGGETEDLTQAFFVDFLEDAYYRRVDPAHGRFRSFLLVALKRFLLKAEAEKRTLKRGGRVTFTSCDPAADEAPGSVEISGDESPEIAFERSWALSVIEAATARLREEAAAGGKLELFEHLREFLTEPPDEADYARVADALGLRPNTLAVAVHRLRRRLRDLVREELAQTALTHDELKHELRDLRAVLAAVMT